jgi:hypothetical protein
MILWLLTPGDVQRASVVWQKTKPSPDVPIGEPPRTSRLTKYIFAPASAASLAGDLFGRTRTALLLRHFLDLRDYGHSFQVTNDSVEGFLMANPSAEWKQRLRQIDSDAADMEGRANAVGIPFVAVLLPTREQAIMISRGDWPAGYDPYKLGDDLRAIVTSHGGTYIDILHDFKSISDPKPDFFPADGHPNPAGHAKYSRLLARALTNGAVPALGLASQSHSSFEKGN